MPENDLHHERWFQTALDGELQAIEGLPSDLNIRKPNNPFWQSIFRIAGVAKTGFISKDEALNKIKWACRHMNLQGREIEYQWGRAYQRATARYLND